MFCTWGGAGGGGGVLGVNLLTIEELTVMCLHCTLSRNYCPKGANISGSGPPKAGGLGEERGQRWIGYTRGVWLLPQGRLPRAKPRVITDDRVLPCEGGRGGQRGRRSFAVSLTPGPLSVPTFFFFFFWDAAVDESRSRRGSLVRSGRRLFEAFEPPTLSGVSVSSPVINVANFNNDSNVDEGFRPNQQ